MEIAKIDKIIKIIHGLFQKHTRNLKSPVGCSLITKDKFHNIKF